MSTRGNENIRFVINLIFAVYNCILGIASGSVWFLTVGAYYVILSFMRSSVIVFASKDRKNENFIMKFIGMMIFGLSIVLCFIVYMTVGYDVATRYHQIVMITIALYSFIKITLAIIGFVKQSDERILCNKTLTSITLADSVVSIYSLQRSMLVSFDGMIASDIVIMNSISGIGMCVITVCIGLNLIFGGKKNGRIKNSKSE